MTLVIQLVIFVAFFGVFGLTAWYVPRRLIALLGLQRRRWLYVVWAAAVLACIFSIGLATSPAPLAGILYVGGGWLFMAHGYLFLCVLAARPFHARIPMATPHQAGVLVAVAIATTALGAWQADDLRLRRTEVTVEGLERELTVMHVSDVHLGHHRGRAALERVVKLTNEQQPDFIVITGDLVDGNIALEPEVLAPLADFAAPAYFTTGNHETYVDFDRALRLIAGQGVHVLRNEMVETHGVQLIGLDYMNADGNTFDMHPADGDRTIQRVVPGIPVREDAPVFVMHHSPVGLEYIAAHGTDLMFTGHTHAGQVFPGTVLAPFIFRLNRGLYDFEGMQVFVSQGAGTFGPRMRLGSNNELDVLRLRPR